MNGDSINAIAEVFRMLGQPARVSILLAIGEGEACVRHLEAHLGLRQALISQHLMLLREAGLVLPERDGRNVYYRLANVELLDVVLQAAALAGIPLDNFAQRPEPAQPCSCPRCNQGYAVPREWVELRVDEMDAVDSSQ